MKQFTNMNIKKESRYMTTKMIIFLLIMILSFGFAFWGTKIVEKVENSMTDMHSAIVTSTKDGENKKAYIDVTTMPYEFAISEETGTSFYIVADAEFLYIVYMNPSDFNRLNDPSIEENAIRIEGITKTISEEIKMLALEAYNDGIEEQYQISSEEFYDYFGTVYLDLTADANSVAGMQDFLFLVTFLIGFIGFFLSSFEKIKFHSSIKKMDLMTIQELDQEMNDENAFYYEKAHLYLTNQYIINFKGRFIVLQYQDIVWMYSYQQRVNGIRTSKAIKVMTNEGKTYTMANIEIITQKKKEVYEEIWNMIIHKNPQMLLGYTKENIKEMKERFKKRK